MQTTTDNKISSLDSLLKEVLGNQSTPLISEVLADLNRKMNDIACIISDMSERVEKEPKNAELKANMTNCLPKSPFCTRKSGYSCDTRGKYSWISSALMNSTTL